MRPKDLYKDGLQRARFLPAIELIEKNTEVLAVRGRADYRLRQLTQAGTYVKSGAADSRQRLERAFRRAGGSGSRRRRTKQRRAEPSRSKAARFP